MKLCLLRFIALVVLHFSQQNLAFAMTSSSSSTSLPKLKFIYPDHIFWRAECIRMTLELGNVPFEDARPSRDGIKQLKEEGKVTFGGVPILEVDDTKILSQTQAIAVYVSKLANMYPTDDIWLQAKVDECLNGCTDVTTTISKTFSIPDANEKVQAREEICQKDGGRLYMHLNGLEQICTQNSGEGNFSVGSSLTVADLAIWRLIGWIDGGVLDGIPLNFVKDNFPGLKALYQSVDDMPKVQEWKQKFPKHYSKKE